MKVRFWGTRGSFPVPGARTVRYGGNTSCTEVLFDDGSSVILDSGTGIIPLGFKLMKGKAGQGKADIHILFSHAHWDHIQGFPYFTPSFIKGNRITVYGYPSQHGQLGVVLEAILSPHYHPEGAVAGMVAERGSIDLGERAIKIGPARIRPFRIQHPADNTVAFRIEADGKTLVYSLDVEHTDGNIPDSFIENIRGADLLIHDGQYTPEEYRSTRGWGHSTYPTALEAARRSGAGHLVICHHDPDRTDDELANIMDELRKTESSIQISAAQELETVSV